MTKAFQQPTPGDAGYQAGVMKRAKTTCPYKEGTQAHKAWMAGYNRGLTSMWFLQDDGVLKP